MVRGTRYGGSCGRGLRRRHARELLVSQLSRRCRPRVKIKSRAGFLHKRGTVAVSRYTGSKGKRSGGAGVPVSLDDETAIAAAPENVCAAAGVAQSGQKYIVEQLWREDERVKAEG